MLCFLVTPVSRFVLLPYYRKNIFKAEQIEFTYLFYIENKYIWDTRKVFE